MTQVKTQQPKQSKKQSSPKSEPIVPYFDEQSVVQQVLINQVNREREQEYFKKEKSRLFANSMIYYLVGLLLFGGALIGLKILITTLALLEKQFLVLFLCIVLFLALASMIDLGINAFKTFAEKVKELRNYKKAVEAAEENKYGTNIWKDNSKL